MNWFKNKENENGIITGKPQMMPIEALGSYAKNPKAHPDHQIEQLMKSIQQFGFLVPIVVNDRLIAAGEGRLMAAKRLGMTQVPVVDAKHLTPEQVRAFRIADNKLAMTGWEEDLLTQEIEELKDIGFDMDLLGFTADELDIMDNEANAGEPKDMGSLARKFGVPPFSVLDARQGYWQERKRKWLSIGLSSEAGRGENLLHFSETVGEHTSVFDPVLTEMCYRWFTPKKGSRILDPFAGGSVRGIVAGSLGFEYVGIDLRKEQVEANDTQALEIFCRDQKPVATEHEIVSDPLALTPVDKIGDNFVKRDDCFTFAGVRGGKVRTCLHLATANEARGLVTAGSISSPQVNIVAHIAKHLGVPARLHIPGSSEIEAEVLQAQEMGGLLIKHKPGYNTVIVKRAHEDAAESGYTEIPFGMECPEAVTMTKAQVQNIPWNDIKRLLVPVDSGMTLAGILQGMQEQGIKTPVLGVVVGADPSKRLNTYAPESWKEMVTLTKAKQVYKDFADVTWNGIILDPHYEGKCVPFIEPQDCLWIVGCRNTASGMEPQIDIQDHVMPQWIQGDSQDIPKILKGKQFDLVFSCPPYYDLERYCDNPQDLSNLPEYKDFLVSYRSIIAKSVQALKPNRFAAFVVGEIRDKTGIIRGFIPDTIKAFEEAGARFYNEMILVTAIGSLALRTSRIFPKSRKVGRTHQNVLVFFKGDPKKILEEFPELGIEDVGEPGITEAELESETITE